MTNQRTVARDYADLLKYYVKLRDHRCGVTEGIRAIAFRNVDHLSRAAERLGITNTPDETSRILVQNRMLEDQGLERTHTNRWLLALATWVPWEIYMCLLCAEVENYKTVLQKHTSLVYAPLGDYLASHQVVVQSLEAVRDAILHPLKNTTLEDNLRQFREEAGRIAPDPLLALVTLQGLIDDYLESFRASIGEWLADEISMCPDEEILEFHRRREDQLNNLRATSENAEAKSVTRESLEDWRGIKELLFLNVQPNFTLTAFQRSRIARWEQTMYFLALPLPERPYLKSRSSVQTPVHRELSSFIPAPQTDVELDWTGLELPEYIQRNRSGFIDLLARSLVIFNEPYTAIVSDFESRFPGKSRADILTSDETVREFARGLLPLETVEDYRQAELRTSPSIVATALLAEPLREYKRVIAEKPALKRREMEKLVVGDSLATFSRFRNAVFHVPDERTDFLKADDEFHSKSPSLSDYRVIIDGLFKFYLRSPAVG